MFIGCKEKSATELYVKSRTNVVKVKDKVCEVMTEEPFISNYSDVYLLDGCLIVKDWKGYDNLMLTSEDYEKDVSEMGDIMTRFCDSVEIVETSMNTIQENMSAINIAIEESSSYNVYFIIIFPISNSIDCIINIITIDFFNFNHSITFS